MMTDQNPNGRAFTLKSLLAGLVGVLLLAIFGKIAPTRFQQTLLPHQLGAGIYFYFLLLCAVWNPVCMRWCRRLVLSVKEMSVVFLMTFAAAGFSFAGFLKQIYTQGAMTTWTSETDPRWKLYSVMKYISGRLLPNNGQYDDNAIGGFINGLQAEKAWLPWGKVPFGAWGNLLVWGTLILLAVLMCLALLMVVHRQWIVHEKLNYPLVSITESLFLKKDEKNCFADLFHARSFQIAFGFVCFIHLYNFLVMQFSTLGFEPIRLDWWLSDLPSAFPVIARAGVWSLRSIRFVFLLIGIAFFLAPALSFSVGANGFLYLIFAAQLRTITGLPPSTADCELVRLGAYLAFVLLLLVLGRRYYGRVLLLALGIRRDASPLEKDAVFGCRMFLIFFLGFVYVLTLLGMSLLFALILALLTAMVYLVYTRIVCECGLPVMDTAFLPSNSMSSLLGDYAMGPQNLMTSGLVSGVMFADLKQLFMPFCATGLKLGHDAKLKLSRNWKVIFAVILLTLAVAVPIHLRQYYSFGISDPISKSITWKKGVTESFLEVAKLHTSGQLEESGGLSVWQSIRSIAPGKTQNLYLLLAGMAFVFLCGILRSRFLWWPIHPLLFCIWNTPIAFLVWPSFLLGWLCRVLAVRLGGEQGYLKMKPFFLGLVFGDVAMSGILLLIGMVYALVAGHPLSIPYMVFPIIV